MGGGGGLHYHTLENVGTSWVLLHVATRVLPTRKRAMFGTPLVSMNSLTLTLTLNPRILDTVLDTVLATECSGQRVPRSWSQ